MPRKDKKDFFEDDYTIFKDMNHIAYLGYWTLISYPW